MHRILARVLSPVAASYRSLRLAWTQPPAPIRLVDVGGGGSLPPGSPRFDADRAFELLRHQCAFGPRIPGSEGHRRAGDWLLEALGEEVDVVGVQSWTQRILRGAGAGWRVSMRNLFGLRRGTRDAGRPLAELRPDLMLCAHWDTRPIADHDPDPARRGLPVPGANDGASGVAVLLEVARVLRAWAPERTVMFAFWDGEDLGQYCNGSRLYARMSGRHDFAPWRPRRAVLLDMVGGDALRCTSELNSRRYAPALWGEVHDAAVGLGLGRHFGGPARIVKDDHVMLNQAGIPAIVLIDFEYPYWHTTGDTVEQCRPESLGAVGDVVLRFVLGERYVPVRHAAYSPPRNS